MLRRLIASRGSAEHTCYCGVSSRQSGMFKATFLLNRSGKRQQSGQINAVGHWFQSGLCKGLKSANKTTNIAAQQAYNLTAATLAAKLLVWYVSKRKLYLGTIH